MEVRGFFEPPVQSGAPSLNKLHMFKALSYVPRMFKALSYVLSICYHSIEYTTCYSWLMVKYENLCKLCLKPRNQQLINMKFMNKSFCHQIKYTDHSLYIKQSYPPPQHIIRPFSWLNVMLFSSTSNWVQEHLETSSPTQKTDQQSHAFAFHLMLLCRWNSLPKPTSLPKA